MPLAKTLRVLVAIWLGLLWTPRPSPANGGGPITFSNIAAEDGSGITFRRQRSPSEAIFDAIKQQPFYTFDDLLLSPLKGRGAPGVAVLDVERDGDLDLYVTNGPGTANSLYLNQQADSGVTVFIDVATAAGIDATDQDSTGVCFGDLDNDGDHDLMVLGNLEPNRLFENLSLDTGDVVFKEVTAASIVGDDIASSASCAMGDIDLDGRLDLVVSNTLDWRFQFGIFVEPFAFNEPNQLLRNLGGFAFEDISASSGFLDLALPAAPPGAATISWAVATVDIDQDGDVDIVHADDQAAFPGGAIGGTDRGYLQLHLNDGSGQFTPVSIDRGLDRFGAWMGMSFGDFDHNGEIDVFGTNFGNHGLFFFTGSTDFSVQNYDSRWFLQQGDGSFVDASAPGPLFTPFGWGNATMDYDNDGHTDILFHGALDVGPFMTTNPGGLLRGDGTGRFERDTEAMAATDHLRRTVHGVAVGDLDRNGFVDFVSVSNQDFPEFALTPAPDFGGEFAQDAVILSTFIPAHPTDFLFTWSGIELDDGTLAVELSDGASHHRWLHVETLGAVGLTPSAVVNRDGIGAVVRVDPRGGPPTLHPIVGGGSHASQSSIEVLAGLGHARWATVDVLWPGGVRNRLYRARAGSRIRFPEIPCSIDAPVSLPTHIQCVRDALSDLRGAGVVTHHQAARFFVSAILGFLESR